MSAARAYLFADFGKGPRVVPTGATEPTKHNAPRFARNRGYNARAWWLVECESAEAGRELIAEHVPCGAVGSDVKHGRILASGGAA